jgi:hypothetical protein
MMGSRVGLSRQGVIGSRGEIPAFAQKLSQERPRTDTSAGPFAEAAQGRSAVHAAILLLVITFGVSGCSAIRDTLKPKPPEPLLLQGDKSD